MSESFAAYDLAAISLSLDLGMGREEILEEKLMDRIKSYLESFSSLAHYLFSFLTNALVKKNLKLFPSPGRDPDYHFITYLLPTFYSPEG